MLREAINSPQIDSSADTFSAPESAVLECSHATEQQDIDHVLSSLNEAMQAYLVEPGPSSRPMTSISRTSPLAPQHADYAVDTPRQRLMEDIQAHSEALFDKLSRPDAQLVKALISLLICTDRLFTVSQALQPVATGTRDFTSEPTESLVHGRSGDLGSQHDVYRRLEREATSLQENRRERWAPDHAAAVLDVAREVEQAERELLWGRIDDLSEQIRTLSQQKAQSLQQLVDGDHQDIEELEHLAADHGSPYEPSISGMSDLPQYSHEQQHEFRPPAYDLDASWDDKSLRFSETLSEHSPSRDDMSIKSSAPLLHSTSPRTQRVRDRRISSAASEKMRRDLDSVSHAIERLYIVAPQLADQRVEPDRARARERQLAKLGNAIERLSVGRLEDQRAVATPTLDIDEQALQIRSKRRDDEALHHLIAQIDRAASRTLLDQRVDLR